MDRINSSAQGSEQGDGGISRDIVTAMQNVLAYLWTDELKDYRRCTKEERKHHIFLDILPVQRFLKRKEYA